MCTVVFMMSEEKHMHLHDAAFVHTINGLLMLLRQKTLKNNIKRNSFNFVSLFFFL